MEAKAVAKTIGIAPRKIRLVLDLIRGENAAEAIIILELTNKASSSVIGKVLMPALANTEHDYDISTDGLVVKEAYASEGLTLECPRPHVQGRASAINKRTSHTTIVVDDGKEGTKEA